MKKSILLTTMFLLTSLLFSIDLSTGNESGTLNLYRPNGFIGAAVPIEVMINQSIIMDIERKEAVELKLNPGEYLIHLQPIEILGTKMPFFAVFKVDIKSGETTNVEISPKMSNFKYEFTDQLEKSNKYNFIEDIEWIKDQA